MCGGLRLIALQLLPCALSVLDVLSPAVTVRLCVFASAEQNLAKARPTDSAEFTQYPLAEYNRFNLEARTWSGPETHVRVKPAPYSSPNGPRKLDVPRRHDLIKNLKKNTSNSNYDHGRPFVAKHTNNLLSC